ncbi:MAG: arylsulfatase [Rikenellaceae bacterium]
MNFKTYPQIIFSTILATSLSSCNEKDITQNSKPNVIVILIDDAGYGDMSAHGNPYIQTPQMDRLVEDGIEFTDFHVDPTSAPTRSALMTGRYSSRVGVWLTYGSRDHLRRNETTVADIFKSNGYRTAVFGKWHLGENYPFRAIDRGFEEALVHGGGVVGETPDYWNNCNYDDTYFHNGIAEKQEGYCTDVWFNGAKKFIDNGDKRPFFIYIPTNAAHAPHAVTTQYAEQYIGKERAEFYGMINSVDENLGALRSHLEDKSLSDNTIIVVLTDNGTAGGATFEKDGVTDSNGWEVKGYNAGMRGRKSSAYEGGHRATSIFYWKDGKLSGGTKSDALTSHIDILPTLMELCGIENSNNIEFDGTSLVKEMREGDENLKGRTIFVHHQGRFGEDIGLGLLEKGRNFSVMQDKWRLVGKELYDLSSDPSQKRDIAAQKGEIVAKLTESYNKWFESISENSEPISPFVINPEKQYETLITSQNLIDGLVQYNQRSVRGAVAATGWTMIDVESEGKYNISLRRWPKEADAAFGAVVEAHKVPDEIFNNLSYTKRMKDIVAMDIVKVSVAIDDKKIEKKINPNDKEANFLVDLSEGEHKIECTYTLSDGKEVASYYSYISPI